MNTNAIHYREWPGPNRSSPASSQATSHQSGSHHALVQSILHTLRGIGPGDLVPVAPASAGIAYEPRSLMSLLTYCYATGVLASVEIEETLARDAMLRLLCNNEYPDWHAIRRFRKCNREALLRCLRQTQAQWAPSRPPPVAALPTAGIMAADDGPSRWSAPDADPPDATDQAETLIDQAVWLDSMHLDV